MVDESSDYKKLFQTIKKVDIQAFFIFSSDILNSLGSIISVKQSSKSLENNPNFPATAKENIFIFIFFL